MKILYECEYCMHQSPYKEDIEQCEANCKASNEAWAKEHSKDWELYMKAQEDYDKYCSRCWCRNIDPFKHIDLMEQGCWSCHEYDKFKEEE